jgi:hypothetical protein
MAASRLVGQSIFLVGLGLNLSHRCGGPLEQFAGGRLLLADRDGGHEIFESLVAAVQFPQRFLDDRDRIGVMAAPHFPLNQFFEFTNEFDLHGVLLSAQDNKKAQPLSALSLTANPIERRGARSIEVG